MSDLQQQIALRFGWRIRPGFDTYELQKIAEAGETLVKFIETEISGYDGELWIRKNLGRAVLHKGGLPQTVISKANNGAGISLVFLNHHVWLYPRLFSSNYGKRWLIHELGHVLDNSFRRLSIWFGGGPSDALFRALGQKPTGLRWMNTDSVAVCMPGSHSWHIKNEGKPPLYGDNSSADYFAETFTWAIYDPTKVPPAALAWLKDWLKLTV